MTHDYKRNGTTTLFAALNVLTGEVLGRTMQRHRHQEFIRFLDEIERNVPKDKTVHVILDNYAAHKHDKVRTACPPPALDVPLHTNVIVMAAECGRRLLRKTGSVRLEMGCSIHSWIYKPQSIASSKSITKQK